MPQYLPMDTPRIAVVGSTNLDLIAYTPRIPGPGETLVGDRFHMGFGGKGANQAVMARLLGAEVAMVNCVGDDAYGPLTRANLAGFGIDVTHVHTVAGASGVAPIWVEPGGTNRIIIIPGANHHLTPAQAIAAVTGLPTLDVVIGQFEIPQEVTLAAFAAARARGAITILNPAPGAAIIPGLLPHCDWVIPNQVELGQILDGHTTTDDAALLDAAERLGCGLVVTLGEAGAALVAGREGDEGVSPKGRTPWTPPAPVTPSWERLASGSPPGSTTWPPPVSGCCVLPTASLGRAPRPRSPAATRRIR